MPRKYNSDDDEEDEEGEALILHQLEVNSRGKPIVTSIPGGGGDDVGDEEEQRIRPRQLDAAEDTEVDKTGRPQWLVQGLATARNPNHRPVKVLVALFLVMLAATGIFLALGHLGPRRTHRHEAQGEIWEDNKLGPYRFPIDVGYPGITKTGEAPNLAEELRPTGTQALASQPMQTTIPGFTDWNPFEHMGPLSPYLPSVGFGINSTRYRVPPQGCTIEQVHILHRHGSRYPTSGSPPEAFRQVLEHNSLSFTGPLSFLKDYKYRLGAELLTPVGRGQLYDSGVTAAMYYGHLVDADLARFKRILARAGSQQRIVDSGLAWLNGFFGAQWHDKTDFEVQIEAPGFNCTLAPNFACPSAGRAEYSPGTALASKWAEVYLKDAIKRLQPHFQGVELVSAVLLRSFQRADPLELFHIQTPNLVIGMQQLCSYDTVAFGRSDFCELFTKEEWLGYEYNWDLKFWGNDGPGSPIGAAMGVGWVNEFLSRLSHTPWVRALQTSENATLNTFPQTFPVDRRFYVDFTHDSTITVVLAALQLPELAKELKADRREESRMWKSSSLVPFAARLVFELLSCASPLSARTPTAPASTQYVRLLLNDAIMPLSQLPACEDRPDGLCGLEKFVESQKDRMRKAQWEEKCKA